MQVKVIEDSISKFGDRLTTLQVEYPRFILPQMNTHRVFSRSYSSSRAIPIQKLIDEVRASPAMPVYWGKNKPGMQASEELTEEDIEYCKLEWIEAAINAADSAEYLLNKGLHKQTANRLLEPFLNVRGVITATEWDNFFKLRIHPTAQPEICKLATLMKEARDASTPKQLGDYEMHLPYVSKEERSSVLAVDLPKISAARCARASYNKHDGSNPSVEEDLELFNQLAKRPYTDKRGQVYDINDSCHLSPLEHSAEPALFREYSWARGQTHTDGIGRPWSGNFKGWIQYRQKYEGI
jgi:thymidylate synthase ThyX